MIANAKGVKDQTASMSLGVLGNVIAALGVPHAHYMVVNINPNQRILTIKPLLHLQVLLNEQGIGNEGLGQYGVYGKEREQIPSLCPKAHPLRSMRTRLKRQ
jgi:hypothetical protein